MISNNFDHVGRTLGPEVARQAPPVCIALDQLEKDLHFLREGVGHLSHRLSAVMRPIGATDGGGKPMTPGGSPLTNQIETLAQLTRLIGSEVSAMLDCIEI
jgi:hypothetical protein